MTDPEGQQKGSLDLDLAGPMHDCVLTAMFLAPTAMFIVPIASTHADERAKAETGR